MALVAFLLACDEDATTEWQQYNADNDAITVVVGTAELLPMVSTTLDSSTGEVPVGTASVDPGGGPIGTVHVVKVEVLDEYADDIDRVSVRTSSAERDEDEYDLDADSTGEGIYKVEIISVGETGESRDDTFTFRLWSEVEDTGDAG